MLVGGGKWEKKFYSISFTYNSLIQKKLNPSLPLIKMGLCVVLYLNQLGSVKVVVFSWKLLLDKLPSRVNLRECGVLLGDVRMSSSLCGSVV